MDQTPTALEMRLSELRQQCEQAQQEVGHLIQTLDRKGPPTQTSRFITVMPRVTFWALAQGQTYRADDWKRLPDGSLVVLLGSTEVATWGPGKWSHAYKADTPNARAATALGT